MRLTWAFLIVSLVSVRAADVTFSSGARHVTLIELFTSEGCSSCPPAERWLSEQGHGADLWQTFVPVSWHVDYWNRLGWPDRFSTRDFTQRQYDYVKQWHGDSVYTPCFVRDGLEWRPGGAVGAGTDEPSAVLTIRYDGRRVRGELAGNGLWGHGPGLELHAVLLGAGIRSKVTAGENRGETLEHDFVALKATSGGLGDAVDLQRVSVPGVQRYALAAWVTRRGNSHPIQAVGGWLR